jgi:hypothetical protein
VWCSPLDWLACQTQPLPLPQWRCRPQQERSCKQDYYAVRYCHYRYCAFGASDSGQRTVDCARSVWHSGAPTPRPRAPGNDDQGPQELHDMPSTQHAARAPQAGPYRTALGPASACWHGSLNQVQCSTPRHPTNVTEVRRSGGIAMSTTACRLVFAVVVCHPCDAGVSAR